MRFCSSNIRFGSVADSGSVILEFALLLPLILFLSFSGVELARAFNSYETLAGLSGHAAKIVFDSCGLRPASEYPNCVKEAVGTQLNTGGFLAKAFPKVDIVISVYAADTASANSSTTSKLAAVYSTTGGLRETGGSGNWSTHAECDLAKIGQANYACSTTNGYSSYFQSSRVNALIATSYGGSPVAGLPPQKPLMVIAEVFYPSDILFKASKIIMPFQAKIFHETTVL